MTPNMPSSGRVDVLAVLRRMEAQALAFRETNGKSEELRDSQFIEDGKAIDAIVELIEALRLCRDELAGIDGHVTNPDNPDGWTDADLYAAYAKAGAALAAITEPQS